MGLFQDILFFQVTHSLSSLYVPNFRSFPSECVKIKHVHGWTDNGELDV
jgi:hypothetical protein